MSSWIVSHMERLHRHEVCESLLLDLLPAWVATVRVFAVQPDLEFGLLEVGEPVSGGFSGAFVVDGGEGAVLAVVVPAAAFPCDDGGSGESEASCGVGDGDGLGVAGSFHGFPFPVYD